MISIWAMVSLAIAASAPSARIKARTASLFEELRTAALRLSVDTARLPDSVKGPEGATGWRLERDEASRPGGTEVAVLVWLDKSGSPVRRDWIQVRVEREELVPSARGRFQKGERLDSSRLDWQWKRTTGMRVAPPARDSLDKFRTRTGISPGQSIWRTQLEFQPVFGQGEIVKVRAGNNGAWAMIEAVALEDGFPGSVAHLKSPFGKTIAGVAGVDGIVTVR